ncbi:hypothetical protein [Tenacibaculum insulae]|uniref:hypothetical protein n=1 Tax=Tenacibaculum insulae TaxID=2029677 RepID=UPI003AB5353F
MDKELQHKIDFINQKAGKKTGFSTPENYFDAFDENVNSLIASRKFSKQNAFKTPSNYFDSVESNILTKLKLEENKKVKVIPLYQKVLKFMPVAAAAAILLFIGLNYFNTQNLSAFDKITQADISSWYENGYGDTNNSELAIVLDTADFEEDILPFINDTNLEDYINTIDDSSLLNDLE